MNNYIVQPRDTLIQIAQRQLGNTSYWSEIAKLNGLHPPYPLFIGQPLVLPNFRLKSSVEPIASPPQSSANLAWARGFLFIVAEQLPEVGSTKLIRKVFIAPKDYAKTLGLSINEWRQSWPEYFGLEASKPSAHLSLAEHARGASKVSQFVSASNRPFGAVTIAGRPVLIDIHKMLGAGAKIYSVEQVVADLQRFAMENPSTRLNISRLIDAVRVEGEVLIEGKTPNTAINPASVAHLPYIQTAEEIFARHKHDPIELEKQLKLLSKTYTNARITGRVCRVLTAVGIIVTVKDIAEASRHSIQQHSFKPIAAESIRQAGGWGGAMEGIKIGFGVGAAFGIETGPGAIVTGAVGAITFGALSYIGADLLADQISSN